MIRILLPTHTYNDPRIKLVERLTNKLQPRQLTNVRRAYTYLEFRQNTFLEGFLENEGKLERICEMLADNPIPIEQTQESFPDMRTYVIEDGDDIEGVPY